MGKKVKSKDIASFMGLSGTLVSLVLNNKADHYGIKKETKERVLAVAAKLGYFDSLNEPKEIIRVQEQPGIIGMIVTSMNDPFVFEIAPYLQKAFAGSGMGFSVFCRDSDDMRFSRLIKSMKKFFSGIILVGEAADDETIRSLARDDYPLILLEKSYRKLKMNSVCSDRNAGYVLLTNHLSSLGYKNLLVVSDENTFSGRCEVLSDLKSVISNSGKFDTLQHVVIRKPLSGEIIDFSLFKNFLRPPSRTDCIIVIDAAAVLPVIASINAQTIRIPQDVALVSLEDYVAFDQLVTPVTRLRIAVSEMALKTAGMLWTEIKNKGKGKYKHQVIIPPELVIRSSCGSYLK